MYTIKHAIEDVHKANTGADLKEIEDIIIKTIESEILPHVLLNITLPEIPSPAAILVRELRSRRRGIRCEEKFRNFQRHINLIKNLEYVKSKIQYERYINRSQEHTLLNGSGNQILCFPEFDNLGKTDYEYPKILLDETHERLRTQLLSEKSKQLLIIDIMDSIIDKISVETTFKNFLNILEKSLRKSDYINEVPNVNINEIIDYEISSWKKIIINLKPKIDDFDKNIIIWDSIQKQVREGILRELNELSSDEKTLFNTYLKNLYFHMQFPEE